MRSWLGSLEWIGTGVEGVCYRLPVKFTEYSQKDAHHFSSAHDSQLG
jgi:hypothetical protein